MRLLNRSVGRLSRYRRSRLAGLTVMLLGLVLAGGLYTVVSPAQAEKAEADPALVEEGRKLFLVGCAFCHGKNGEGILTENGNQIGPSLVGVGAAAVDFQVGTGRMPLVQPGTQAPAKAEVYTDEERLALASYVASLGAGPAIPDESDYTIEGLSEDEREAAIVNGGQIFLTNCTACHNFTGAGGAMPRGKYAPKLLGVSDKHIYEALLTGPSQMPVFSNGNLTPEDKRDVIAYLKSLEDQPNYGGFTLGSLGPVTEGLFGWIFGIGGLVGFAVWIAAHTTRSKKDKLAS
ncbi:cytochrome bc1 complex diheme cytochrome c subunit [Nocardioides pacificus]